MKKLTLLSLALSIVIASHGQSKKILDHSAYDEWRTIENQSISSNGKFVQYTLGSHGYADPILKLHDDKGKELLSYDRASKGKFTWETSHLIFKISPADTTLRNLKRIKTKKDKLPKDTLAIYQLASGSLVKIPHLQSYKTPEKWDGWIAYQTVLQPDTANKKMKKSTNDNGYPLTIHQLSSGQTWELPYTKDFRFSERGNSLAAFSEGNDSTIVKGVYVFDTENPGWKSVFTGKGEFTSLSWDESGKQLVFVADIDTTKALTRNPGLYYWQSTNDSASLIVDSKADRMPSSWQVNSFQKPRFSQDGKQLYFGINPPPIKQDTSLLEDEIVNVEVWSYNDPRLHTQQKIDAKNDVKKGYTAVMDIASRNFRQLETLSIPESSQSNEGSI